MNEKDLYALRYPVGEYEPIESYTSSDISNYINIIENFPEKIKAAVQGLSDKQLDTPYREGGWTIRQVVHHTADSHINSYCRFKLALTEDTPEIKPYNEAKWAELPDGKTAPVELSLPLLDSLHKRWCAVLKGISPDKLERKVYHSEAKREMTIAYLMGLYAWHCEHHLAHVVKLKKKMNWQ